MSKNWFSHRKGFTPARVAIQRDSIDDNLKNSLWNVLVTNIFEYEKYNFPFSYRGPSVSALGYALWKDFFKKPLTTIPHKEFSILNEIQSYYFSCEWHEIYAFLEFILTYYKNVRLIEEVNKVLEQELSAYRFVEGVFTDITSDEEIAVLEEALKDSDFPGVRNHLNRALELYSDRNKPDYRNSIKESISAVESIAKVITGQSKASLGDALKTLEKNGKLHSALKEGFLKLYGYTNDEEGIRHAMLEEPNLSAHDAKYWLLSCTTFINYLKSRI
jgi:hypothetical protein